MFMTRGAAFLLLVVHLLLCVHSIDQGTVIKADPDVPSPIVAIWIGGRTGTDFILILTYLYWPARTSSDPISDYSAQALPHTHRAGAWWAHKDDFP